MGVFFCQNSSINFAQSDLNNLVTYLFDEIRKMHQMIGLGFNEPSELISYVINASVYKGLRLLSAATGPFSRSLHRPVQWPGHGPGHEWGLMTPVHSVHSALPGPCLMLYTGSESIKTPDVQGFIYLMPNKPVARSCDRFVLTWYLELFFPLS